MRLRGLLVGALVLAALAAVLYYSNKQKSAEAAKPPAADKTPKILTLAEVDITKISLKKKGGDETVVEKNNAGKWQVTAPKQYLADQDGRRPARNCCGPDQFRSSNRRQAADLQLWTALAHSGSKYHD